MDVLLLLEQDILNKMYAMYDRYHDVVQMQEKRVAAIEAMVSG
jgi:hypothetical protein